MLLRPRLCCGASAFARTDRRAPSQDFPHGAVLSAGGKVTDFVCLQFINQCDQKQDLPTLAACRAAKQDALEIQVSMQFDIFVRLEVVPEKPAIILLAVPILDLPMEKLDMVV
ncbi:hypothetical protein AURDEDRAFT_173556 [Auricularia subglabra TFB-10046 SS5]|nr:hypothetical protein AURDEDRAFT_173556 [Auricularia subglabra TFB-10046 SS5]